MNAEKTEITPDNTPETKADRPLVNRLSRLIGVVASRFTPRGFLERVDAQAAKRRERIIERYLREQSGLPVPSLGRRAVRAMREKAPSSIVHNVDIIRKNNKN